MFVFIKIVVTIQFFRAIHKGKKVNKNIDKQMFGVYNSDIETNVRTKRSITIAIGRFHVMIRLDFSYFIKSFFIIISRVVRRNSVAFGVCIILFSTLFLSIGLITTKAAVKDNEPKVKQIISLKIQECDTLWGIASEYITSEYDNMNEFIEEIKTTNGLSSDTIHEGAYLIVPYYQ